MKNKKVWITGASDGIGKALAIACTKEASALFLSGRNQEALKELQTLCLEIASQNNNNIQVEIHPFDCTDIKATQKVSHGLAGKVDYAIFCAGVSQREYSFRMDNTTEALIYTVNYISPIESMKVLVNAWNTQENAVLHTNQNTSTSTHTDINNKKQIIIISSIAAHLPAPLRSMYGASKAALEYYTETMRNELRKSKCTHINISTVIPGFVNTNISQKALLASQAKWNKKDRNQQNGISPEKAAQQILSKTQQGKEKIYVGMNLNLYIITFLYKHIPKIANKILSNVKTT